MTMVMKGRKMIPKTNIRLGERLHGFGGFCVVWNQGTAGESKFNHSPQRLSTKPGRFWICDKAIIARMGPISLLKLADLECGCVYTICTLVIRQRFDYNLTRQ